MRWQRLTLLPLLLIGASPLWSSQWQGEIELEGRLFANPGTAESSRHNGSIALTIEHYRELDENLQLNFKGFGRLDSQDSNRSHADIRELYLNLQRDEWEFQAGINTLFWGVTESVNIVDIVNQSDAVEGVDSSAKLGQPLLKMTRLMDNATLDLLILPLFRERAYAGTDGRFQLSLPVATDLSSYESNREDKHVDYALRYAASLGDLELGLSGFTGTSREPLLQPTLDSGGNPVLAPYYPQIKQLGIDLQWISDAWLWKLEMTHRQSNAFTSYSAAVGGFEYTLYDPFATGSDLGIIVEGLYDERGDNATTPFAHDLMLGLRWVANDEAGSEALAGFILDGVNGTTMVSMEGSRRFNQNWKGKLEMRIFNPDIEDLLYTLRDEDYLQLTLTRYF